MRLQRPELLYGNLVSGESSGVREASKPATRKDEHGPATGITAPSGAWACHRFNNFLRLARNPARMRPAAVFQMGKYGGVSCR